MNTWANEQSSAPLPLAELDRPGGRGYLDAAFVEQMLTQGPTGLRRIEEYLLAYPQDILALTEQLPHEVLETLVRYLAVSQHPVLEFLLEQLGRLEHGLQIRIVHLLDLVEPDLRENWLLEAIGKVRQQPDILSELLGLLEPVGTQRALPDLSWIAADGALNPPIRVMAFNLVLRLAPLAAAELLASVYRQERGNAELWRDLFLVLASHPLPEAVPLLEQACRERELEPACRIAALGALVAAQGWGNLAQQALLALFFRVSGEPKNLLSLLSWLEEYPTPLMVPLCEAVLSQRHLPAEVKSQALALLGDAAGAEFYAILEEHWQESDPKIQTAAAYALVRHIGSTKSVTRPAGPEVSNGVMLVPDELQADVAQHFLVGDFFLFRRPPPVPRQGLRRPPAETAEILSFCETSSLAVSGLGTVKAPTLPKADWLLLLSRQPVYLARAEPVQILALDLARAFPELSLSLYREDSLIETYCWPEGPGGVLLQALPALEAGTYRLVHDATGTSCHFQVQEKGPLPLNPQSRASGPLSLDFFGLPVEVALTPQAPDLRGLDIRPGAGVTPLLQLQYGGAESCQLLPQVWLDDLRLVVLDPVSGQSQAFHFSGVPRGEALLVPLARAPFSIVLAGAWTHQIAWEGGTVVIRQPGFRFDADFAPVLAGGEPLVITLETDQLERSIPVLVMLSDQAGTPGEALSRYLLESLRAWAPLLLSGVLTDWASLAAAAEEVAPEPELAWEAPGPALAWPGQVYWQLVLVRGRQDIAIPLPQGPARYHLHLLALDTANLDWRAVDGLVAVSGK